MKCWKPILLAAILIGLLTGPVFGQRGDLQVHGLAVGTNIFDRAPQGVAGRFDTTVGKLYAFTRVVGAQDHTEVYHRWYWEDQLIAEVTLPVRSASWRTWSSKTITPKLTGSWRVEIVATDGSILDTVWFTLG